MISIVPNEYISIWIDYKIKIKYKIMNIFKRKLYSFIGTIGKFPKDERKKEKI